MEENNLTPIAPVEPTSRQSTWRQVADLIKTVLTVLVLSLVIRIFIFQPNIVDGSSMYPNLSTGQYLGVDKLSYHFHNPARGDIIIFKYPLDTTQVFVKRVIGLPGETVRISGGKVTILNSDHPQGQLLNESSYLSADVLTNLPSDQQSEDFKVPEGEYFVLGDNRPNSSDSRYWGFVPQANIEGRAFIRMYPFNQLKDLARPSYNV